VVWIIENAVMQVVGVSTARTAKALLDRPRGRTPGQWACRRSRGVEGAEGGLTGRR